METVVKSVLSSLSFSLSHSLQLATLHVCRCSNIMFISVGYGTNEKDTNK